MTRHPKGFPLALALACSLGGVSAGPAGAFVLQRYRDPSNGKWYPVRWKSLTRPIPFVLNDQTHAVLPDFLSDSAPTAAVEATMQTWAFAPLSMRLAGLTSQRSSAGRDNFNLITLANTAANRDIVSNNIAVTQTWLTSRGSLNYWPLVETDVIFNPKVPIATDGRAAAFDFQAVLTHELGHALGLGHSSIPAATMWPYGDQGEIRDRTPDADDAAAIQAVYGALLDSSHGTITGRVLAAGDVPVFGATVIATDGQGIARCGAFTERHGSYTLSWLPPSVYSVHAEAINTELSTDQFSGDYYQTAWRDFPASFLGGNNQPTLVPVAAGAAVAVGPIRIFSQRPRLAPKVLGSAPDGEHFAQYGLQALTLRPGSSTYLLVGAEGLTAATDIQVSGTDVGFDKGNEWIDELSDGTPFAFLPMSVRPGAAPGARNLYLSTRAETSAFSGAIKVIAP